MKNILAATALILMTAPAFAQPAWTGEWNGPANEDWGGSVTVTSKGIEMMEAGYTFTKVTPKADGGIVARATFSEAGDCQSPGPCKLPVTRITITPKGKSIVIDFGSRGGPTIFTRIPADPQ